MTSRHYRNPRLQRAANDLLTPDGISFAPRPGPAGRLRRWLRKILSLFL